MEKSVPLFILMNTTNTYLIIKFAYSIIVNDRTGF
jgi:hypothetical protein